MILYEDIQRQRHRERAQRENAARLAMQYVSYVTVGAGQIEIEEPIIFDSPMFHEPAVTSGYALVQPPHRDYFKLPHVSAGVMGWERSERGFYLGAYLYFTVDVDPLDDLAESPPIVPSAEIIHHFTFTATSYKLLGRATEGLEDAIPPIDASP